MASSKKPSSSRSKSSKSKAAESKIEDAVIVEKSSSADSVAAVGDSKLTASETEPDTVVAAADDTVPAAIGDDTLKGTDTVESIGADTLGNKESTDRVEDTKGAATTTAEMVHPVPATAPPPRKDNTFLPLVLGGIIAGVIGFMAAELDVFGKDDAGITTQLRGDLNAQQERIAALENAEAPTVDVPEVDLTPLETQLATLEERLAALEDRPAVLLPEGVDTDAAAAYAAELEALQSSVETQRGEIEALINNAKSVEQATADAAKAAAGQSAIAKIVSAIDAGRPFPEALADLKALDLGDIDPALENAATDGVATLSTLQAEFPDQARTALSTARASGVEEGQQGLGGFLKRSLGARSVAPREGTDPDAVLSRAEANINTGDLAATLNELDTLPEEAQAAIADWRAAATARLEARAAADALAQRLTAD